MVFRVEREGIIRIPWRSYRPHLRAFVNQIELHFPNLTKGERTLPALDLISAVNAPEPERRKLFAEFKRMGYGADCMWALYKNPIGSSLYMRRSLRECVEYMAQIEAD